LVEKFTKIVNEVAIRLTPQQKSRRKPSLFEHTGTNFSRVLLTTPQRAHQSVSRTLRLFFYDLILVTAIGGRPKPEILLLARAVEVNALAQGALRRFTP